MKIGPAHDARVILYPLSVSSPRGSAYIFEAGDGKHVDLCVREPRAAPIRVRTVAICSSEHLDFIALIEQAA